MGWLQPWPSSSFVLRLNTSTINRTWKKCIKGDISPLFTCSLFHTIIFSHNHTFLIKTIAHLFNIAAHLALVVLQHFSSQLLISCVFRCKIPNFLLKDSAFIAHPVQQYLLQGHLRICWDEILQDVQTLYSRYAFYSKIFGIFNPVPV